LSNGIVVGRELKSGTWQVQHTHATDRLFSR
jgi:hypothetical protein